MNGLFVWDASLGVPKTSEERFFVKENTPKHDTSTANYQAFLEAIKPFVSEADQHYPDMYYQGFYVFDNGISFEPLPEEILHAFSSLIYETAIYNGLCVYDSLSDSLYTIETAERHYPKGNAKKIWQEQLDEKAKRLQEIDNEEFVLPQNSREADKLTNKLVRERLKQEGIKNIKKDSNGYNYIVDFGDIQLELYIDVFAHIPALDASVYIYLNVQKYLKEIKNISLYLSPIDYLNAYGISDNDIDREHGYCVPIYGEEGISHHPELLYDEINRAIDLFIYTYKSCQNLEGLYQFYKNDNNDPRLQSRFIDSRAYEPITRTSLILLAKLTKQPDYESVKQQLIEEAIAWSIEQLCFIKERHEEREESRYQRSKDEGGELYQKEPFDDYTNGNPEAFITKIYLEYITKIDALDVDEILSMDLPKGLRM